MLIEIDSFFHKKRVKQKLHPLDIAVLIMFQKDP